MVFANRAAGIISIAMKKLRVGVVGVGHIGKNHARLYAELPGAQLTAIYQAFLERFFTASATDQIASLHSQ